MLFFLWKYKGFSKEKTWKNLYNIGLTRGGAEAGIRDRRTSYFHRRAVDKYSCEGYHKTIANRVFDSVDKVDKGQDRVK